MYTRTHTPSLNDETRREWKGVEKLNVMGKAVYYGFLAAKRNDVYPRNIISLAVLISYVCAAKVDVDGDTMMQPFKIC